MMHRPPRGATFEQLIVLWLFCGALAGLGYWAKDYPIMGIGLACGIIGHLMLKYGND